MSDAVTDAARPRFPRYAAAFGGGSVIGALGGLIGLGGAEFRLPLLIGGFRFAALEAVILNKAMSLVVVATALPFRMTTVPVTELAANWQIIVNLLAGSLAGAWLGAGWATRLKSETLYRVIAMLLVGIAGVLLFGHDPNAAGHPLVMGWLQVAVGVAAGFGIGVVASLMGVGSVIGVFIGAQLTGVISSTVLLPVLALILVISAMKVWGHK